MSGQWIVAGVAEDDFGPEMGGLRDADAGFGAVSDLVEWIYWRHFSQALSILRKRIWFSSPPTVEAECVIKVAAKRWGVSTPGDEIFESVVGAVARGEAEIVAKDLLAAQRARSRREAMENYSQWHGKNFTDLQGAARWVHARARDLGRECVAGPLFRRSRAIVAALFSADWTLIAAAKNTNGTIRTRHAEINLLEGLREGSVFWPEGARLIVSTQSCRMCAAVIKEWIERTAPHTEVFYLTPEPTLAHARTQLHGIERRVE